MTIECCRSPWPLHFPESCNHTNNPCRRLIHECGYVYKVSAQSTGLKMANFERTFRAIVAEGQPRNLLVVFIRVRDVQARHHIELIGKSYTLHRLRRRKVFQGWLVCLQLQLSLAACDCHCLSSSYMITSVVAVADMLRLWLLLSSVVLFVACFLMERCGTQQNPNKNTMRSRKSLVQL